MRFCARRRVVDRFAAALPRPCPGGILAEHHVEHPVQRVLDAPVRPHHPRDPLRIRRQAGDEVAPLEGGRAFLLALQLDGGHAAQPFPLLVAFEPVREIVAERPAAPPLDPPPAPVFDGVAGLEAPVYQAVEIGGHVAVERALVAFERDGWERVPLRNPVRENSRRDL